MWTNAFGYDAAKRLTSVTSPTGTFNYLLSAHQPSTLMHQLALPNTSYITNTFDANARLLTTTLKNSSHATLNSHSYSYNPGNQRTQQVFSTGSTYSYAYDSIGQLKVADSASASEDRGYTYDAAWNLNYRTNNATLQTFSVDGLNQLTSAPSGACSYDGNGNLIFSSGGLLELTYDDENRLSTVQSNLVVYGTNYGLWKTLYAYDGKGRLRRRVELQVLTIPAEPPPDIDLFGGLESMESEGGGSHPWGTNNITQYIYDGWRVIQERNGSNNVPTVSYTRGTDLSGSLESAGGIGGLLARSHGYSSGNWSTHNYYHADGNGNVTYLVAANQGQAARYRYDPYGNLISGSETLGFLGTPNTYRFSSKMVDLKSGYYYYGYRWYEPNFQRWLNRDPIAEKGGINLFQFVHSDPVFHRDHFGMCCGCPKLPGATSNGYATINGRLQCIYSICGPSVTFTTELPGTVTTVEVWVSDPHDYIFGGYCVTRTCAPVTVQTWKTSGGCVSWVDNYDSKCQFTHRDVSPPPNTQPTLVGEETFPNCLDIRNGKGQLSCGS